MRIVAAHPTATLLGSLALLGLAVVAPQQTSKQAPKLGGGAIFAKKCAPCHGAKGQGGKGYSKPLAGSLSVAQLAKFVHANMPPGPSKLPETEAESVAKYAFDAFYSPVARERNRPPRVELSRLTVKQYRNAVADLVAPFYPAVFGKPGGLRAEYFKARSFDGKERVLQRVDPMIQFDWGNGAPAEAGFDAHNFSAAWEGSVLAPDTGEYEFVIQSDQAVRMWVNDAPQPVVDGWIRSTDQKEFSGTATLLGGRTYHVRVEFTKATPGVDDAEKRKGKPIPHAGVTLLWRRPKLPLQPIASRFLYPDGSPRRFVSTTPFPPDDRSVGYERGNSVSKEWEDAVTAGALEAAGYIVANLQQVTGVPEDAKDRKERLRGYCREFLRRAFRRPSTAEIEHTYVDKQFETAPDVETAVKRSVIMTLISPRFLYREIGPSNDPYVIAANISFGLWDTIPDQELLQIAAQGELARPDGRKRQIERLLADPRSWNKLRDFLLSWLRVDEVPDLVKSASKYPDFDPNTAADLRTSLELFLQDAAWDKSDYRQLMLANREYLNGRLAKLYGANLPADADFQPVALDEGQRAGLLTQPYLLARLAYIDHSSPIHRGVLIVRSLLGRTLSPPPAAFVPLPASAHPEFTTRERVAFQTKPKMCTGCHGIINPLGFTLERFDAIGRLREQENGKPVDTSGSLVTPKGETVPLKGATDLASYLADSDEAQGAFVEKLFQNLVKQPVRAYGPDTKQKLLEAFRNGRYNIRSLMAATIEVTAGERQ